MLELGTRLEKYLGKQGFKRGVVGINTYIKLEDENMITVVFYVDDIIFGSKTENL